ncbi:hypothetical protein HK101_008862 [Irineochytrium annulatum]|nr:hypothetical protein HK101_008862 [Irineochytrium annulatum]
MEFYDPTAALPYPDVARSIFSSTLLCYPAESERTQMPMMKDWDRARVASQLLYAIEPVLDGDHDDSVAQISPVSPMPVDGQRGTAIVVNLSHTGAKLSRVVRFERQVAPLLTHPEPAQLSFRYKDEYLSVSHPPDHRWNYVSSLDGLESRPFGPLAQDNENNLSDQFAPWVGTGAYPALSGGGESSLYAETNLPALTEAANADWVYGCPITREPAKDPATVIAQDAADVSACPSSVLGATASHLPASAFASEVSSASASAPEKFCRKRARTFSGGRRSLFKRHSVEAVHVTLAVPPVALSTSVLPVAVKDKFEDEDVDTAAVQEEEVDVESAAIEMQAETRADDDVEEGVENDALDEDTDTDSEDEGSDWCPSDAIVDVPVKVKKWPKPDDKKKAQPVFGDVEDEDGRKDSERGKRERFKCDECGQIFPRSDALYVHSFRHLPYEARPFPCDLCDMRFCRKHDQQRHVLCKHTEIRSHLCKRCGSTFARSDALKRHNKMCQGTKKKTSARRARRGTWSDDEGGDVSDDESL